MLAGDVAGREIRKCCLRRRQLMTPCARGDKSRADSQLKIANPILLASHRSAPIVPRRYREQPPLSAERLPKYTQGTMMTVYRMEIKTKRRGGA